MISGKMSYKFKTFKNDKSKKTLDKYEWELHDFNVKEHIEKIKALFEMDLVLNIRNHLNSYFPNVRTYVLKYSF